MKHFEDEGQMYSNQASNIFQIKCVLTHTKIDVDAKFLGLLM